ncbi:MAG TPA: DoxX family protein [Candidatus Aquilonibacter sp.]|nr:DoxX family protein [Candidatus Aquilonibacter sp.]
MESTVHNPASARTTLKNTTIVYWMVTALFCLEMSFTAYYELLPHGVQAFTRLGFPNSYFRIELSLAKLAGVAALLIPLVPPRLKEWAYAGFAINLVSAVIAHLSIRDIPLAFAPSTITSVLWALSYYFWHRLQATRAHSGANSVGRPNVA